MVSDHRSDNISEAAHKNQLMSTLQKDLLQLLEHLDALQEAQRALHSAPHSPNTTRLLLETDTLHLHTNGQLACLLTTARGTGLNQTQHLFPIIYSALACSINGDLGGHTTK